MKKVISILVLSAALFISNTHAMEHEASAAVAALATAHPILTQKPQWSWGKIAAGAAIIGAGAGAMYKTYTWYKDLRKKLDEMQKKLAELQMLRKSVDAGIFNIATLGALEKQKQQLKEMQEAIAKFSDTLRNVKVNGVIEMPMPDELEDLPGQIEKIEGTLRTISGQQSEALRKLETLTRVKALDKMSQARYARRHGMGESMAAVVESDSTKQVRFADVQRSESGSQRNTGADQVGQWQLVREYHVPALRPVTVASSPSGEPSQQQKGLKEKAVAEHTAMPAPAGDPEVSWSAD